MDAGLSHAEFWRLSMRELLDVLQAHRRRQKADHEARAMIAALQTAELVNVVGALGAGKKWRPIKPLSYFDAWTGNTRTRANDTLTAKEHRAKMEAIQAGIKAREARKRAKQGQSGSKTSPDP